MKTKLTILLLLISFCSFSQNYKFGKISKDELAEKQNSIDTSANAAVLYKSENISFQYRKGEGFFQIREVHERIKIYNKDGYKWATKRERLYDESGSRKESLKGLKGYTYNLVNGKIEAEKLKKDGIFEEEINKYWKAKSFTMPKVNDGCIVEYTYQISSPFSGIDDIELQYLIPILKLDISIKTPEFYLYNKLTNPRASYVPRVNESTQKRTETFTSSNKDEWDSASSTNKFTHSEWEFNENVIKIDEANIPALKDEPFVGNLSNYQAKLILELVAIKFPNQPYQSLSTDWDKVTKSIYDNSEFGNQLSRTSYYQNDIDALLSSASDLNQKLWLIFNFVKSKVQWNEFYGYSSDVGVRKAYKDGVGNVADINLMLVSMLRYAGFNANPVLVSAKNNGIPLYPTRKGFNYVVCIVENGSQNILLDATEEFNAINVLPTRALNWQGRIIRQNGTSGWINLSPKSISNDITYLNVKINSDLTIEGKVRQQKTDYVAMNYRKRYARLNPDEHIKRLERDNGELEVVDVDFENKIECELPLKLTYNYTLNNGIEDIGGNLYFSPMLFFASEENPFKQESRHFPIDLAYPFSDKYMINIMIPEGYGVESLPSNEKIQFKDAGEFTFLAKENGNFLQLSVILDLKSHIILASDYEMFKAFYSKMIEKQSEKIVLKKI